MMSESKSWNVSGIHLVYGIIVLVLIVRSTFFEYEMDTDGKMLLGWAMIMMNIESLKDLIRAK